MPYYACYICQKLVAPGTTLTLDDLYESSQVQSSFTDYYYLLSDQSIIETALQFLEGERIVRLITDEFAPQLIIRHEDFDTNFDGLLGKRDTVFNRYKLAGEGRASWLHKALENIGEQIKSAQTQTDQEDDDEASSSDDFGEESWAPIPLERTDKLQQTAVEALERTLKELRGDNGYAVAHPEEKAFVQDAIASVTKRLKEDSQISWIYIREFAVKPLMILIARFGKAALGVTASVARDSLFSWLKNKGGGFLDDLFK
ncbi:hypothetical protein [Bradyrhizobium sp. SZCCHNR2028]|uniref:hypothetical protein n=1 Tax=Bradyrhizobium sp. SZCCHNR2028 TaxID=3057382 RepID=UPI0028EBBFAA|nr:hypothetical protein [Bradyrhizobium sp. SZCCHNR2028]